MPWVLKGSVAVPQLRGLDRVVGTRLEPFLRGFQECGFQMDVQKFVERHASTFAVACPDGSHPLLWTEIHHEYKGLFERQMEAILSEFDIAWSEFLEWMEALKGASEQFEDDYALPGSDGVLAGDFNEFLTALTASDDYETFLHVMYHEVCKLQARSSDSSLQSRLQVSVTPPVQAVPGQMIHVNVLGVRHSVEIPAGYAPGASFQAVVTEATKLPQGGYPEQM